MHSQIKKRGFLRNSHKYGLGSLRKTPTEGTSHIDPGPISEQLAFNLQNPAQPTLNIFIDHSKPFSLFPTYFSEVCATGRKTNKYINKLSRKNFKLLTISA